MKDERVSSSERGSLEVELKTFILPPLFLIPAFSHASPSG